MGAILSRHHPKVVFDGISLRTFAFNKRYIRPIHVYYFTLRQYACRRSK